MNRRYLGDALDHWKGSLLELLEASRALRDLGVDPVAGDLAEWTAQDVALYARLLRVNPFQILRHSHSLRERHSYFAEISHAGDIFLDPDTGVATGTVKDQTQYVRPREVGHLIANEPSRIVTVYQHVRATRVSSRVDAVLASLAAHANRVAWCSYESGTVAMIFLCDEAARIETVRRGFSDLLGCHADGRIRFGRV